jgi:hypothetical protein
MATIRLPADFRDFLKLLSSHRVEVDMISRSDLIQNNLKAGRLKDLNDAQRLS